MPTIRTLRFINAEIGRGGTISAIISNHSLNPIVVGAVTPRRGLYSVVGLNV